MSKGTPTDLFCTADMLRAALDPIRRASAEELERLSAWTRVLDRWARVQRLVGWRTAEGLLEEGICDAWAAASLLRDGTGPLVDLGSGAGLPGLVLAAASPSREIHLVEARRKRAAFLREAAREMALTGVHVHHCRSEDLRGTAACPPGPIVLARAFAPPSVLLAEAALWGAPACLVSGAGPVPEVPGWTTAALCLGRPAGRWHALFRPAS